MRLKKGTLIKLKKKTGISTPQLCHYIATNRRPSRQRSIVLEKACKKLGLDIPKELWLFGTQNEIKAALSNIN